MFRSILLTDIFELMDNFFNESFTYLLTINWLEAIGLIFGLLAVFYLIKESILTWPTGIAYILVSFIIFWQEQLYGDLLLHIFFLALNIYGWYFWKYGRTKNKQELKISWLSLKENIIYILLSLVGILLFGLFLSNIHLIFTNLIPASVPYWDAATTSLSIVGMWLTARKKIENWAYWLVVDILAVGIYSYKELYFYALLYFVYIGLAILGFRSWKKILAQAS